MEKAILLKKISFVSVNLIMALFFIGCGGDGGSSKSSTKACPSNAYYNHADGEWYNSSTDLKICNPLPGVQPQGCDFGEVVVRSPFEYNVNYDPRYMSDATRSNPNYHRNRGSYQEICMIPGGNGWNHVTPAGFYYYVNLGMVSATLNAGITVGHHTTTTYTPIIHQPRNNNTAVTILALGVLAALFLAN